MSVASNSFPNIDQEVASILALALTSSSCEVSFGKGMVQSLLGYDCTWIPFRLAEALRSWHDSMAFPHATEWEVELYGVEQVLSSKQLEAHTGTVCYYMSEITLQISVGSKGDDDKIVRNQLTDTAVSLLTRLGPRVLAALLHIRTTVGCVTDALPPSRAELLDAFERPHRAAKSSRLTVGARALAKHCHRGTKGWWGSCKGSESVKNLAALELCQRVLNDSVWVNLHTIAGGVPLAEYRVAEGYGARWSVASSVTSGVKCIKFRGFLEPQMEGGHEKGWRHYM